MVKGAPAAAASALAFPEPGTAEEEAEQLATALRRSREEAAAAADSDGAEGFVVVEAGNAPSSSAGPAAVAAPVAVAKAAPKLSARPKPKARAQPRRWYCVYSVPAADLGRLGVHHCTWAQLGVPGGRLAGSGWRCRVFDFRVEALAHWDDERPGDACPEHAYP